MPKKRGRARKYILPPSTKEDKLNALISERQLYLKGVLRKASARWKYRKLAKKRAQIGENLFLCELCQKAFSPMLVQLDHKEPVVLLTGWDDWNGFIERLFCAIEGYQLVCKDCHKQKTNTENDQRRSHRAAKKRVVEEINF